MKLTVWDKGETKIITLKKGDFVETTKVLVSARRNEWKEGIKGYITKPIKRFSDLIYITPVNDPLLYQLATYEDVYTGIYKKNIIAVNRKEVIDEQVKDKLSYRNQKTNTYLKN